MEDNFDNWLAERGKETPEDDGNLLPGTVVGDYRIVALLGHGGFADVYRASGNNGESVAIKILHKLDDKSRARFVRESEILSQIKHRNIPRLLSFGSCGDRPYMVTELLKCCELPSSDHKVAVFLNQIMSAAEELHRHGFIHRDIKPSNILSREDGTPVLIDFGLAAPMSDAMREKEALSVEEGMRFAVGTVGYSAPEQFSGLATGKAADVHAIGAMIYACYRGEMPRCWRRIYLAATASNPKSRYQTVQELRRAVRMRHLRKAAFWALAVVLLGVVTFMCADAAIRRSSEKKIPHRFHIKGL
jgi:serine/threonine protein kinase